MIKSEVLEALVAAGATAEMIVAAIKADEAANAERAEARRANNAERQRRFKAKRREEQREVTAVTEGNALPNVTPLSLPLPPQTPRTPTHTPGDNNTRARKGAPAPAKPDGVSETTWRDLLAHRKSKGAPLTETALTAIQREAVAAGWPLEAALTEMVARGWQGFKAKFVEGQRPPSNAPANDVDPLMRRFLAHKAKALAGPPGGGP